MEYRASYPNLCWNTWIVVIFAQLAIGLNIIENLWSVLKSRVQKRLPKTSNGLWAITKEEWNAISKDEVIQLFKSIPIRLKEVIRKKDTTSNIAAKIC